MVRHGIGQDGAVKASAGRTSRGWAAENLTERGWSFSWSWGGAFNAS